MSAEHHDRSSGFSAWSAIIGAILAATIAGAAGFAGPLYLQQRAADHDERQEAAQARGAARLLFAELLQAAAQQSILASDRVFRRFDDSYRVEMRPEDLRLIAAKLDGDRWGAVQEALTNADGLATFVNTQIERGRRRLTKGEQRFALVDLRSIRYAAEALASLAAATGQPAEPEPFGCKPRGAVLCQRAFRGSARRRHDPAPRAFWGSPAAHSP